MRHRSSSLRVPYINLDLDGVCADFYGHASRQLGRDYRSMPPAEAWAVLETIPHFFATLPVLPGAREIVAALAHHGKRFRVLTAAPRPTGRLVTARDDKRAWVPANLSPRLDVIVVDSGKEKCQFCRPGDVLIDDLPRNIDDWRAAGGVGVLHTDAASTLARLRQLGLSNDAACAPAPP